jgi:hypothetical protein
VTRTPPRRHHPSDERPDGIKQHKDSEPAQLPGNQRPHYVVVVAASDWVKEHYPAAGANLWDTLHTDKDRHRHPNPTSKPNHDPDRK